ncbi:hypothetical protein GCM10023080_088050 [Streptomyces pseudoechinosporeus]
MRRRRIPQRGEADADAARQRELERVGWSFVRIRGSRFFLDPDRALEPLWLELDRLGIESTHKKPAAPAPASAPERRSPSAPAAPPLRRMWNGPPSGAGARTPDFPPSRPIPPA